MARSGSDKCKGKNHLNFQDHRLLESMQQYGWGYPSAEAGFRELKIHDTATGSVQEAGGRRQHWLMAGWAEVQVLGSSTTAIISYIKKHIMLNYRAIILKH